MAGLNADRECGVRPNFSEVARRYGVDRHTVSKYWNGGGPSPDDGRHGRQSGFDRYRDEIEEKAALPGVTAKGIHELLLDDCHPLSFTGGNQAASGCEACDSSNSSGLM